MAVIYPFHLVVLCWMYVYLGPVVQQCVVLAGVASRVLPYSVLVKVFLVCELT